MRKLIMILAGVLLFSGTQMAQASQATSEEESLEIVDVVFDYSYRPGDDYFLPDIVGCLTIMAKVKGIDYVFAEYSACHYQNPDEAPGFASWMLFCDNDKELMEIKFPIIAWGAWARCKYYSDTMGEYVYTPTIWTTDYIDSATLDLVTGGVDSVSENDPITILQSGRDLLISGLEEIASLRIYSIQGQTVLAREVAGGNATITVPLQDIAVGVYMVQLSGNHCSITQKIALR